LPLPPPEEKWVKEKKEGNKEGGERERRLCSSLTLHGLTGKQSLEFKYPQRRNGKTLSSNAVSFLKFSPPIITRLFFTVLV
jgi:hypothetical protein